MRQLLSVCRKNTIMVIGIHKQNCRNKGVILSDRRESKDLRTDFPVNKNKMRRFFGSAYAALRMTASVVCYFHGDTDERR